MLRVPIPKHRDTGRIIALPTNFFSILVEINLYPLKL